MARHVSRYYKDPTEDINEHSGDDLNQIHSSIVDSDDNVIVDAANGTISGDVTGDVTGDLTGDVTGNVTGNITGNVLRPGGDVIINASGDTVTAGTLNFTTGINDGATTINAFDTVIERSGEPNQVPTSSAVVSWVNNRIEENNDLDIAGDTGTGNIELDTHSLTISGTTNEIETSASGQTVTVGLPNNVTISGTLTAGAISGTLSNERVIQIDGADAGRTVNLQGGVGVDISSAGVFSFNATEVADDGIPLAKIDSSALQTYVDGRITTIGNVETYANMAAFTADTTTVWHHGDTAIFSDSGATYIYTGTEGATSPDLTSDFHQLTASAGAINQTTADGRYVRYDSAAPELDETDADRVRSNIRIDEQLNLARYREVASVSSGTPTYNAGSNGLNIVYLTEEQYDDITTKDTNTLYLIRE